MHGPRIEEDGLSGSLSLSASYTHDLFYPLQPIVPSVYAGMRRSWLPADGDGVAGSIGIQVPVLLAVVLLPYQRDRLGTLLSATILDAYIQPGRRSGPGFETGAGILASAAFAGPYIQAGLMGEDGSGWYTTQAVAFSIRDGSGSGTFFLPTIVWRHRHPDLSTATNLSAGMGIHFGDDGERNALFTLGVTFELGLERN